MSVQPAPAVPAGAGCPICGGACQAFPDTPHQADYPFLPGGQPVTTSDKTASERLFDSTGTLVVGPGAPIPAGVKLFTEDGSPHGAKPAASKTAAKGTPVRETR